MEYISIHKQWLVLLGSAVSLLIFFKERDFINLVLQKELNDWNKTLRLWLSALWFFKLSLFICFTKNTSEHKFSRKPLKFSADITATIDPKTKLLIVQKFKASTHTIDRLELLCLFALGISFLLGGWSTTLIAVSKTALTF